MGRNWRAAIGIEKLTKSRGGKGRSRTLVGGVEVVLERLPQDVAGGARGTILGKVEVAHAADDMVNLEVLGAQGLGDLLSRGIGGLLRREVASEGDDVAAIDLTRRNESDGATDDKNRTNCFRTKTAQLLMP